MYLRAAHTEPTFFLPRFQAPQQVLLVLPVAKPVQVSKPRACLIIILHAAFLWLWKRSGWLCNVAETHKCTFHFIISKYTKGCLSADCIFFQEMFISSFALWGFKAQCNLQYLPFHYQEWNALSSTRVFYFLCSFTYYLAIWFRLWSGLKPNIIGSLNIQMIITISIVRVWIWNFKIVFWGML